MSCFNLNKKLLLRLIKCIPSLEGICILKPILYTDKNYLNAQLTSQGVEFKHILPSDSDGKESACNSGDQDLIPGSGRSPGEGNGTHSSSCLDNSCVHGITKSWNDLVTNTFTLASVTFRKKLVVCPSLVLS